MNRHDLDGFAVDIGGTKTAVARITAGQIVDRRILATDADATLGQQIDTIAGTLEKMGRRKDEALGVTVTGRVDAADEWSAVNAGTLTRINRAPLGAMLTETFGRVSCSNDAAAAALAEYHFGSGAGTRTLVYITVSTGVGGGLVIDGKLLRSGSGLAGHLGFSTSRLATERCGSGRLGTVESVASGLAIARVAAARGHKVADARAVFAAAHGGADWARAIIDDSARAIAELSANVTAILDPDRIAIGGSVGLAEGYIARVSSFLSDEPELFRRPLVATELGADGPLLGALAYSMRQMS